MIFDVDDFTLYHRLGRNEIHDEEIRAKYYMKAYYRYSGEFLPMIENVEKLSIIRGFLNSQFLNVSRFLIEFYLKKEEYGIIEEICMNAIPPLPFSVPLFVALCHGNIAAWKRASLPNRPRPVVNRIFSSQYLRIICHHNGIIHQHPHGDNKCRQRSTVQSYPPHQHNKQSTTYREK